jgi:hypothetical protein
MRITDYAERAYSLAIYRDNEFARVFYPMMGIGGEVGELIEKIQHGGTDEEIINEMGDVLWYLVATLEDIRFGFVNSVQHFAELRSNEGSFSDVQSHVVFHYENDCLVGVSDLTELSIYAGKILEIGKKVLRDNQGVVPGAKKKVIGKYCMLILQQLCITAHIYGFNLDDVAQANIDKLFSRRDRGVLGGSGDNR